ncbi:hypothetical protein [Lederbergia galactosidilytica]|uniref:Uncharacterized protein n=1 Tax=Lederbergia galactosidilytica TaxID=217031 RepID=A0A177ZZF2_9BACI|nr:hypothetical protein [Lederbergia galactosidilytica]OAK72700.1 hypothetical protein ABB05_07570 [Lederbergia galactosidilytica]
MYRPTVRYSDVYKSYVDDLFQSTHLDRNQIIRAALFTAAHSSVFLKLMNENKRPDVLLPSPQWQLDQPELWMESNPTIKEERRDVSDVDDKRTGEIESINDFDRRYTTRSDKKQKEEESDRRQRKSSGRIREVRKGGGIRIQIG